MEKWEKQASERETIRKASVISNRKRLKAETVEAIDELLKAVGSLHFDAVEGLQHGFISFRFEDIANLKNYGDKVAEAFTKEKGHI